MANHSMTLTKQSSAWQYWSALLFNISDISFPALHTLHGYSLDFVVLVNLLLTVHRSSITTRVEKCTLKFK